MATIDGIPGISYRKRGESYRLKWRETHETPDGWKRVVCRYTVATKEEVAPLAVRIRASLDARGFWQPPEDKARPMDPDLERLSLEWLNETGGYRNHRPPPGSPSRGHSRGSGPPSERHLTCLPRGPFRHRS